MTKHISIPPISRMIPITTAGIRMMLCLLTGILLYATSFAQPVYDAVNLRYQNSPRNNGATDPNSFSYTSLSINIPMITKKDSIVFVFSPFLEWWKIRSDSVSTGPVRLHSIGLPVSMVMPFGQAWSLTLSFIPRWNGFSYVRNKSFQAGAVLLATFKKRQGLQYKAGLYYNNEFSGPFFMPLLGIDWTIDKKNNLYGVLPGNLTYEHKLQDHMYWGAAFRSVTNTYRTGWSYNGPDALYFRIQEVQTDIYTDLYLTDHIVLSVAAGHSLERKFRTGRIDHQPVYSFDRSMQTGFYGKLSFIYRVRLR